MLATGKNIDYGFVQDLFDKPYSANPAPTKIPAGAMEWDIRRLGHAQYVHLCLNEAACKIK